MSYQENSRMVRFLLTALVTVSVSSCAAVADKYPAVSDDGLMRVSDSRLDAVYWAEGASLAPYTQIIIGDISVAFRKNWQRDQNSSRTPLTAVDAAEMERIRTALEESFRDVFTQELTEQGGYEIVTTPGPGVLLLEPEIVNLDVYAPDVMPPASTQVFTSTAGEMTLRMDLIDAATAAVIGRVIDRGRARDNGPFFFQFTNRLTNKIEAERIMRRWAGILRDAMDKSAVATG